MTNRDECEMIETDREIYIKQKIKIFKFSKNFGNNLLASLLIDKINIFLKTTLNIYIISLSLVFKRTKFDKHNWNLRFYWKRFSHEFPKSFNTNEQNKKIIPLNVKKIEL